MALDTYTNLLAAVASWLNRADLTAVIPDAITMAEEQFNRTIRHRMMEQRATATATEYLDLPSDYLELRRIQIDSAPDHTLILLDKDEAARKYSETTGRPVGYIIIADQLQLAPAPDGDYTVEIDYYEKIPALASYGSNWLLTNYPSIYLWGALLAMAVHIQNDPRLPMLQAQYTALLDNINATDRKQRFSGSAPYTRAA